MQEMLALGHKVDRLEQWIMKVAEATGVKLIAQYYILFLGGNTAVVMASNGLLGFCSHQTAV